MRDSKECIHFLIRASKLSTCLVTNIWLALQKRGKPRKIRNALL